MQNKIVEMMESSIKILREDFGGILHDLSGLELIIYYYPFNTKITIVNPLIEFSYKDGLANFHTIIIDENGDIHIPTLQFL